MTLSRTLACFVTVLLFTGAAAFAQVESTPIPMSPKPDFSRMMFMTGNWSCSNKSSRRPAPFRTSSTTAISTDGYWMISHNVTHRTAWMARDLTSEDKVTYDGSTGRWVDINTGDLGNYNVSTSPGWSGNTITWTDLLITKTNATASTNPTVVTKVSDRRMTSRSSFREPSGRLVTVTATCTKS